MQNSGTEFYHEDTKSDPGRNCPAYAWRSWRFHLRLRAFFSLRAEKHRGHRVAAVVTFLTRRQSVSTIRMVRLSLPALRRQK